MKTMVSPELPFDIVTKQFREDFEVATMILKFAVNKNIGGFSLSGLKVPPILHDRQIGSITPDITQYATELCVFQDHLYDRVVSLIDNIRLQREIWGFNERTREFRETELKNSATANSFADATVTLMNALFAHDLKTAIELIDECYRTRLTRMDDILGTFAKVQERVS